MNPKSAFSRNLPAALALTFTSFGAACLASSAASDPPDAAAVDAAVSVTEAADAAASLSADAGAPDDAGSIAPDAGNDGGDPPPPEACPSGMAHIGRYCIDRFEAHLVIVEADGSETLHPHNERPPEGARFSARSSSGFFPQGYISRVESEAACKNAGKRLCSREEWTRACEGRRGATWTYGSTYKPGVCNSGKGHLLTMKFGKSARGWTYDNFNDPSLLLEPGFLTKSGEMAGCHSDDGVLDMVGNLHEWVSDKVTDEVAEKIEAEEVERKHQGWREGNGMFLGGFFSNTSELGPGCKYITYAHEPTYHDYSTGFRCCAQATPVKKTEPKKKGKKK